MISPKKVADEVQDCLDRGVRKWDAFKIVAQKFDVREVDVRVCASVLIPELYEIWCPNRRKVQVKR